MKTTILESTNSEKLTEQMSKMDEEYNVKFTQYQPVYLPQAMKVLFTAMVFYEEK